MSSLYRNFEIRILTYNAKVRKTRKTAITFAYDVEKLRLIYPKKLEKISSSMPSGFTRTDFTESPNSKRKKVKNKIRIFYKIKKNWIRQFYGK